MEKMLYPVEEEVHLKVVDGGWLQLLIDMVIFSLKVAIFISVGWFAFYETTLTMANEWIKQGVSPECLQSLVAEPKV